MEEANSALKCEKDALELQLTEIREAQMAEQFEVVRLKTLLEQEKKKVKDIFMNLFSTNVMIRPFNLFNQTPFPHEANKTQSESTA